MDVKQSRVLDMGMNGRFSLLFIGLLLGMAGCSLYADNPAPANVSITAAGESSAAPPSSTGPERMPAQNSPPASVAWTATVKLTCDKNPFQRDILLITNMDQSPRFTCEVEVKGQLPEGYIPAPAEYQWSASSGELLAQDRQAEWLHPDPGLQTLRVSGQFKYLPPPPRSFFSRSQPEIDIPFHQELACMIPYPANLLKEKTVNGFTIGLYPDPDNPAFLKHIRDDTTRERIKSHPEAYRPPRWFYPVTPETFRLRFFKEYTLGDFDLDPRFLKLTYPRYVAIHPDLLEKLGRLEAIVRADGVPLTKFKVFYGFRSPAYNLGARAEDGAKTLKSDLSMHMYGRAVDFLIDEDDDLVMDDLNADRIIDFHDAIQLLQYVNQLDQTLLDQGSELVGGAGWYYHHDFWERGEYVQSPYVHMDARGFTSAGGGLIRWIGEDTIHILKKKNPYQRRAPIPNWPW
ncbi:MAG: hypothetical protein ACE15F_23145 [bacterium]